MLVHHTQALKAAYRYAMFNVKTEGEENFRSLRNFRSLE
jgi:hypothetical protein